MISTEKLLVSYINDVVRVPKHDHLWVFDFDDTIVKSSSTTLLTKANGESVRMTPAQFSLYESCPGDQFDFSEFRRLIDPKPIKWMNKVMKAVHQFHGHKAMVILSARTIPEPINEFLSIVQLSGIEVIALNSADPSKKALWIDERIKRDRLGSLTFFDDSYKNVAAVVGLRDVHHNVQITAHHINHRRVTSLCSAQPKI